MLCLACDALPISDLYLVIEAEGVEHFLKHYFFGQLLGGREDGQLFFM